MTFTVALRWNCSSGAAEGNVPWNVPRRCSARANGIRARAFHGGFEARDVYFGLMFGLTTNGARLLPAWRQQTGGAPRRTP